MSIETPEFHQALNEVIEAELYFNKVAREPEVFEGYEKASKARRRFIKSIDDYIAQRDIKL